MRVKSLDPVPRSVKRNGDHGKSLCNSIRVDDSRDSSHAQGVSLQRCDGALRMTELHVAESGYAVNSRFSGMFSRRVSQ